MLSDSGKQSASGPCSQSLHCTTSKCSTASHKVQSTQQSLPCLTVTKL